MFSHIHRFKKAFDAVNHNLLIKNNSIRFLKRDTKNSHQLNITLTTLKIENKK